MSEPTVTVITGFPVRKVEAARHAVKIAHARLVRAAAKAGQESPVAPTITVVRTHVVSSCNACKCTTEGFAGGSCIVCKKGYLTSHEVADLEVTYTRPALAGWEFLAVVEPLEGGNLLRQVPGATVADGELNTWRTGAIVCDHCETTRRRAETFVVRADGSDPAVPAGTYKQVGRQCLSVFLGGKSAAAILASLSIEKIIRDEGEGEGGFGGYRDSVYNPAEFLAWATSSVRIAGWVSKAAAEGSFEPKLSTASHTAYLLTHQATTTWHAARETFAPTDADRARGTEALEWAKGLAGATDYERNLSLVANQPVLQPKHTGILASAVAAYARVLGENLKKAARAASTHVGTVGEKVSTNVTLERVFVTETQYGSLHIHTFRAATGEALVWKTGRGHGSSGDAFRLTGTIKAHSEFKGEPQTELSRCKLEAAQA